MIDQKYDSCNRLIIYLIDILIITDVIQSIIFVSAVNIAVNNFLNNCAFL
jgi:hypothetical protein